MSSGASPLRYIHRSLRGIYGLMHLSPILIAYQLHVTKCLARTCFVNLPFALYKYCRRMYSNISIFTLLIFEPGRRHRHTRPSSGLTIGSAFINQPIHMSSTAKGEKIVDIARCLLPQVIGGFNNGKRAFLSACEYSSPQGCSPGHTGLLVTREGKRYLLSCCLVFPLERSKQGMVLIKCEAIGGKSVCRGDYSQASCSNTTLYNSGVVHSLLYYCDVTVS